MKTWRINGEGGKTVFVKAAHELEAFERAVAFYASFGGAILAAGVEEAVAPAPETAVAATGA